MPTLTLGVSTVLQCILRLGTYQVENLILRSLGTFVVELLHLAFEALPLGFGTFRVVFTVGIVAAVDQPEVGSRLSIINHGSSTGPEAILQKKKLRGQCWVRLEGRIP